MFRRNPWFWLVVLIVVPMLWGLWSNYPVQMGALHMMIGFIAIWIGIIPTTSYMEWNLIGDMDDGAFKRNIQATFWFMFACTCIVCLVVVLYSLFALMSGDAFWLFNALSHT